MVSNFTTKKVGYNFLSVSNVKPPAFDGNSKEIEQTGLDHVKIKEEYYEMVLLLLCGKFYLSKWLTYGDDFHVTGTELMSFKYPFDKVSEKDKDFLHQCYLEVIRRLPSTIQFKLNAGINVGTFNTSLLWNVTDKSDKVFLKYISDNADICFEDIETLISKCVISDKN